MKTRDILDRISNGSVRVVLWKYETGEVILETIWYNLIPDEIMDMDVVRICVRDYELRLGLE